MIKDSQSKTIRSAIIWGIISLVMYIAVFLNQQTVTEYFTRGGVFAAAVIVTALLFSFVHGAFASYFIDAIGFKPVNKGGH